MTQHSQTPSPLTHTHTKEKGIILVLGIFYRTKLKVPDIP